MIPRKLNGKPLATYGLLDICNNHDFILIDTSAATDTTCAFLEQKERKMQMQLSIKYSGPLELRIEYNAMIGLLMTAHELYITELVLEEIYDYRKHKKGGLLKSIDQLIRAAEVGLGDEPKPRVISLQSTPEYDQYKQDPYLNRLAELNGLSNVDLDLLVQFFAGTQNIYGKHALISNDRGIINTYKTFGHRLPNKNHKSFSCLFSNIYKPTFPQR